MSERCGWESDYETFASAPPRVVRASLADFVKNASESQLRAWDDSIPLLQDGTRYAMAALAQAKAYTAILEYQLPLETRRPDVILIESGAVVVIEFKGKEHASAADLDQVGAYARDLRCYHRECAPPREVFAVLVPLRYQGLAYEVDGTWVVAPSKLENFIQKLARTASPPLSPIEGSISFFELEI